MILFCLPYAGGSQSIYYKWKNYLATDISLYPIELKGRGKRFNEPYYKNLEEAVNDIFINIKDIICNEDYAIYGHSMGSLLAYELYYKICEMGITKPKHVFFSGYQAPHIPKKDDKIHNLSNCNFINKVVEYGGIPEELLTNKELLDIYIPILRNDFKIVETYVYKPKAYKIKCDISVLNGKEDSLDFKDIVAWNQHTSKKFTLYTFKGNHFFINSSMEEIIKIINNTLEINSMIKSEKII